MWEKIVLNLLSNAFKFTFEGRDYASRFDGAAITSSCRVARYRRRHPAESDLPRMFQRFHRVKHARARTHEGTGIGLALVQELARLHGGAVAVESQEGRGHRRSPSAFERGRSHLPPERIAAARQLDVRPASARCPLSKRPCAGCRQRMTPPMRSRSPRRLPSRSARLSDAARVLVADDNADMRDYLMRILGQQLRRRSGSGRQSGARTHPGRTRRIWCWPT